MKQSKTRHYSQGGSPQASDGLLLFIELTCSDLKVRLKYHLRKIKKVHYTAYNSGAITCATIRFRQSLKQLKLYHSFPCKQLLWKEADTTANYWKVRKSKHEISTSSTHGFVTERDRVNKINTLPAFCFWNGLWWNKTDFWRPHHVPHLCVLPAHLGGGSRLVWECSPWTWNC